MTSKQVLNKLMPVMATGEEETLGSLKHSPYLALMTEEAQDVTKKAQYCVLPLCTGYHEIFKGDRADLKERIARIPEGNKVKTSRLRTYEQVLHTVACEGEREGDGDRGRGEFKEENK